MKGQGVVLAEREELDRALDDLADVAVGPTVTLGRKGGQQLGVTLIPVRRLEERAEKSGRRRLRPRCLEVHSKRLEDLGGVALELRPLLRLDSSRPDLLPLRSLFR